VAAPSDPPRPPRSPGPHGSPGDRPLTPPPAGARRTAVLAFVGAYLALVLLTPLRYYLGDDPYDERFAWRMFSDVRLRACTTELVETVAEGGTLHERRPPLEGIVHFSWREMLARNRRAVVVALLEARCEGEDVVEARIVNTCQSSAGEPLPTREYRLECASGALTAPGSIDDPALDAGGEAMR